MGGCTGDEGEHILGKCREMYGGMSWGSVGRCVGDVWEDVLVTYGKMCW